MSGLWPQDLFYFQIYFTFTWRTMRSVVDFYFPLHGSPGVFLYVSHPFTKSQRSSDLFADTQGAQAFQVRACILEWRISFFSSLDITVCNVQFDELLDIHHMSVFLAHFRKSLAFVLSIEEPEKKMLWIFVNVCLMCYVWFSPDLFLKRNMKIYCPMVSIFSHISSRVTSSYSYSPIFPLVLQFLPG